MTEEITHTVTDDMSMYDEYFTLTKKHKIEQGNKAVVLLNCGIFYEMYGYEDKDGSITGSDIEAICNVCDLQLTEKSKIKYKNKTLYQAGFRDFVSDKFVNMIIDAGYTAVLYIETDEINPRTKKKIRKLEAIYSAGTYIPLEPADQKLNNHIMVLWLEEGNFRQKSGNKRPGIVYGMALLNIYNGNTYMYEQLLEDIKIQSTTFDELEKNVSIFRPSEIVLISNLSESSLKLVKQYTGISRGDSSIHVYDFANPEVKNCAKQNYIKHALTQQFGDNCWESCEEFQTYPYAVQAFCYLLHFVQSRNGNLVKHIEKPVFHNKSSSVILANHTLRQLNILLDHQENGQKYGHLSSVGSFLNKCVTAMGKRKFQYVMTHPSFDKQWLQQEYDMMSQLLTSDYEPMIDPLRKQIGKIRDLEKTSKLLVNRKLSPTNIYQLHESAQHIQQINVCLAEMDWLKTYLAPDQCMETQTNELTSFIEQKFNLDACKNSVQKTSYDENIIQPGVSHYLDQTLKDLETREKQIQTIENFFNHLYNHLSPNKKTAEIIKVNTTEKNIVSLQLTKTRSDLLKKQCTLTTISLDNGISFEWSDVSFISSTKANNEISFPFLNKICSDITRIKNELHTIIHNVFLQLLGELEDTYYDHLENMSKYVANLDVILAKCYCASTYHYCCPQICKDDSTITRSFVEASDMRHVLIEQLQQDELYVTNDVHIGTDDTQGILLYGTNAVGKTSYIRALGICVVMAQVGMFVPCSSFYYQPYEAIYSRIIGNDNLFKGLSTYAVEISELRTILNNADQNSLVLGDELCSGTETVSALSVVMASLIALHEKKTTFILASHFHELVQYDELKSLTSVKLKHMEVWYDAETDALVYDRKLKDGPGQRTYGLEVCKSLYFPDVVLTKAYDIRQKYHPEFKGFLSQKQTTYNAKKIKDQCERCGSCEKLEIHHLQEQHKADEKGIINGQFHKNHPANLMTLCEKCHDEFHHEVSVSPMTDDTSSRRTIRKMVKRKTTKGFVLQDTVTVQ